MKYVSYNASFDEVTNACKKLQALHPDTFTVTVKEKVLTFVSVDDSITDMTIYEGMPCDIDALDENQEFIARLNSFIHKFS